MNFHARQISYKKYGVLLVTLLFFIAVAIWLLETYFGALYGDLTRIGQLDERDFGWQMHQPTVPEGLLKSYPLDEADVLVIGDSFSNGLIWQSRLISAGYKPSTLSWRKLKPCSLGANLGQLIRHGGFRGHYVVIENVEHGFQDRMSRTCELSDTLDGKAYNGLPPQAAPPTDRMLTTLSRDHLGGAWVMNALVNKIKLAYFFDVSSTKYLDFGNAGARVVPIDGCNLFSNRLCSYGVFYAKDFEKKTFSALENVLSMSRELRKENLEPIWLVVPDKATVYLGYGKLNANLYVNVWDNLAGHTELVAPNLGEAFRQQSRLIKDFYKPNDVHLSTNGYLYLGDLMVDLIKRQNTNHAAISR